MAKSIRSKRMKRLRSLKRAHYMEVQGNEKLQQVSALQRRTDPDRQFPLKKPPNMFLYPSHPDAQVPKHQDRKIIDFRSESVPLAGFTAVGVMRDPQKIRKGVGAEIVTDQGKDQQKEEEANVDELAHMMGGMGLNERAKRWEQRENRKYFGEERRVEKKVDKQKKRCDKSKRIQSNFKKRQFK